MEHYDPNRVWERVQSAPAADFQNLGNLLETLHLQSRIFQQLARKLPQPLAAIAREVNQGVNRQLSCLKGMHILVTGTAPTIRPAPLPTDPADLLLRQCYAQAMRLRAEYESRRNDPAYGSVFRSLANDLPQQSRSILELLGALVK